MVVRSKWGILGKTQPSSCTLYCELTPSFIHSFSSSLISSLIIIQQTPHTKCFYQHGDMRLNKIHFCEWLVQSPVDNVYLLMVVLGLCCWAGALGFVGSIPVAPGLESTGSVVVAHEFSWAFLVAQLVKNPPAMQETLVWFLGWEDPLEKG